MSGRNETCPCGSGAKFKKCCGPRGGLTEIAYAEVQAYKEAEARKPRKRTSGGAFLAMAAFAATADPYYGVRSRSNRRRK